MQNLLMRGEDPVQSIGGEISTEELEMLKNIRRVNNITLSNCERRCYDLLVKMEKEISWDTLIRIKAATFITEEDS